MSKAVEFFFDFGSPTSYLAWRRLTVLQDQYDAVIDYRPFLLGGVFKATGNSSPIMVPAKGKYMLTDMARFAEKFGIAMNMNPYFPVNTLPLMRGAYGAKKLGCFDDYVKTVFEALWVDAANMGDPAVIGSVLSAAGLDAGALIALTQDPEIKRTLIKVTEEAVNRGAFGAPTMFMDGEMYFGQDRIDFIEDKLSA